MNKKITAYQSTLSATLLTALAILSLSGAVAEEQQTEHGAHQHGSASVTFVLDGNEAELVLSTAAGNIIGFEHKAGNATEQQQQEQQLAMLKSGSWFVPVAAANCSISGQDFREEQTGDEEHKDLYVNFQLLCQAPLKLSEINFALFSQSPALEKIAVQYLVNGEAGVAELSAKAPVLKFAR